MSVAYVDTSVLTAIAFDEPGAAALAGRLDEFTRLVSSNLLEAELRIRCDSWPITVNTPWSAGS